MSCMHSILQLSAWLLITSSKAQKQPGTSQQRVIRSKHQRIDALKLRNGKTTCTLQPPLLSIDTMPTITQQRHAWKNKTTKRGARPRERETLDPLNQTLTQGYFYHRQRFLQGNDVFRSGQEMRYVYVENAMHGTKGALAKKQERGNAMQARIGLLTAA